jgi:Na+-transporting methylmalonyl-CoA/oxaloacetate decarboxylase gamma subunit
MLKPTILLLAMMQAPAGRMFGGDDDAAFAGNLMMMLKIFAGLIGVFLFLSFLAYLLKNFGPLVSGALAGEAEASAAVPSSRAMVEHPAIVSCEFCGARLTRSRVTEGGNCVSCGGPVGSAALVL